MQTHKHEARANICVYALYVNVLNGKWPKNWPFNRCGKLFAIWLRSLLLCAHPCQWSNVTCLYCTFLNRYYCKWMYCCRCKCDCCGYGCDLYHSIVLVAIGQPVYWRQLHRFSYSFGWHLNYLIDHIPVHRWPPSIVASAPVLRRDAIDLAINRHSLPLD